MARPASGEYRINFVGDVMLGRLIDQLFSTHVDEPSEAKIVKNFLKSRTELQGYSNESPWGTALPMFLASDLNIINLETSVTTHPRKWPDKVFNYRMHPRNIEALKAANVHYAGLANNHTLDFCEEGLRETIQTLQNANVAFAGAGLTPQDAVAPAILKLPGKLAQSTSESHNNEHEVQIWAASDHPQEWGSVKNFHLMRYDSKTRDHLKAALTSQTSTDKPQPVKVFSVHWGPNYSWQPAQEIKTMAHFLIDECGVDIIHGHSSHHVQGVEVYKGKLIIYGCGDFVDDYALVADYRNDLSAVWRVSMLEKQNKLALDKLEIFPSKISSFKAQLLDPATSDHAYVVERISKLSADLGTAVRKELGIDGQLVIDLAETN